MEKSTNCLFGPPGFRLCWRLPELLHYSKKNSLILALVTSDASDDRMTDDLVTLPLI